MTDDMLREITAILAMFLMVGAAYVGDVAFTVVFAAFYIGARVAR